MHCHYRHDGLNQQSNLQIVALYYTSWGERACTLYRVKYLNKSASYSMPSLSPERGRSRSRHFAEPDQSTRQHSTPRRSISPRTASRTPPKNGGPHDRRNGVKGRSRSPRRTPSGSRSRGGAGRSKRYRERSYSRSRSRTPIPKSSKVGHSP